MSWVHIYLAVADAILKAYPTALAYCCIIISFHVAETARESAPSIVLEVISVRLRLERQSL